MAASLTLLCAELTDTSTAMCPSPKSLMSQYCQMLLLSQWQDLISMWKPRGQLTVPNLSFSRSQLLSGIEIFLWVLAVDVPDKITSIGNIIPHILSSHFARIDFQNTPVFSLSFSADRRSYLFHLLLLETSASIILKWLWLFISQYHFILRACVTWDLIEVVAALLSVF